MAKLTGDEIAAIRNSPVFIDRIKATLLFEAQYFNDLPTAARTDVNRRMQKRKRLAKSILRSNWIDSVAPQIGQYWLAYYTTTTPVLDGAGIPTYAVMTTTFDPTYDAFAGYLIGDENELEIEW